MRQFQTLRKQLQPHTRHDPRRNGKHGSISTFARRPIALSRHVEPHGRHTGPERLRESAEDKRNHHGLETVIDGEIQWERHGEPFGDVVDEEGDEDGDAEFGVGVIRGIGDEAFGEFVEGDGNGGLEANFHEGVRGDVMVVMMFRLTIIIIIFFFFDATATTLGSVSVRLVHIVGAIERQRPRTGMIRWSVVVSMLVIAACRAFCI